MPEPHLVSTTSNWGFFTQLFSDPGKKGEPFLEKPNFSGAATKKREEGSHRTTEFTQAPIQTKGVAVLTASTPQGPFGNSRLKTRTNSIPPLAPKNQKHIRSHGSTQAPRPLRAARAALFFCPARSNTAKKKRRCDKAQVITCTLSITPGVDSESPFFPAIVLFKNRSPVPHICWWFSRKKDPWKEWGSYP